VRGEHLRDGNLVVIFCSIQGWQCNYSLVTSEKPVEMTVLVVCQNQSRQDAIVKNVSVCLSHKSRNFNKQLHHVDIQIGALSHRN